jgi:hypothetical protein
MQSTLPFLNSEPLAVLKGALLVDKESSGIAPQRPILRLAMWWRGKQPTPDSTFWQLKKDGGNSAMSGIIFPKWVSIAAFAP